MSKATWIHRIRLFKPDEFECSTCGATTTKPTPFCPNCGRTMRKTKDDPQRIDELEEMDMILDEENEW